MSRPVLEQTSPPIHCRMRSSLTMATVPSAETFLFDSGSNRRLHKETTMKFFTVIFVFASASIFADSPSTFTGVITDTMCGAKHSMVKDQPDDQCIKMCTKGSSDYAL